MKLKEVVVKNKWFVLTICLITLWFVWFQIRPTLTRRSCQQLAYERGNDYFGYAFLQNESALRKSQLQEEYMEKTYNRCLHDKGIE